MNQPNLGLKVSELRQQKGLTQEQCVKSAHEPYNASKAAKWTHVRTLLIVWAPPLNLLLKRKTPLTRTSG